MHKLQHASFCVGCVGAYARVGSAFVRAGCRSWAVASNGALVHNSRIHGPRLGVGLASGDVVRVIYYQKERALRYCVFLPASSGRSSEDVVTAKSRRPDKFLDRRH